jgi:hypothetical protein
MNGYMSAFSVEIFGDGAANESRLRDSHVTEECPSHETVQSLNIHEPSQSRFHAKGRTALTLARALV